RWTVRNRLSTQLPAKTKPDRTVRTCDLPNPSTKDYLIELAADRGAVLTDEEYQDVRSSILRSLAAPPHLSKFAVATTTVLILVGLAFVTPNAIKLITSNDVESAGLWLMIGVASCVLGAVLLMGTFSEYRTATRRTTAERIFEIDDLLRDHLLSPEEHRSIKHSIQEQRRLP
ncbi:MAG TPA: hypothetical protein VM680_15010, partial [Verrucomicrobiae bacterium]|nr:hypothetical protein [Verrucomicrobiae bacterium]